MSESELSLVALVLFLEYSGAWDTREDSGSRSGFVSWSGISILIIDSGEGSLGLVLVGLAFYYILLFVEEVIVSVDLGLLILT